MAERSHLTFTEYLPRAATGAPARPFARHTRGLSRPRGHRFCLKGQKSPTHSKRSPTGHQGERDRGGGRSGQGGQLRGHSRGLGRGCRAHGARRGRRVTESGRTEWTSRGRPSRCPRARPVPRRAGGVNRPRDAAPTLSRRASRPFPGPGRHPALRTHFLCGLQGDGVARSLWQRGRGRGARSFRRRVGPHGYGRRGTENLRPGPGAHVTRLSIARALHALTCVITSAVTLPTGGGGAGGESPRPGGEGGGLRPLPWAAPGLSSLPWF